jgi:hypothetical protein
VPAPPIDTGADGAQPNQRKSGHRQVDIVVSAAAILISLVSLGVGFLNARSEQRMVAASSWPFLTFSSSRNEIAGQAPLLALRIDNQGVGPARLKSLVMRYRGRPVHGLIELLQSCCGLPGGMTMLRTMGAGVVEENQPVGVYSPREGANFLVLARRQADPAMWERLAAARFDLKFEACYCSVLGECWTSDLRVTSDPTPVSDCRIDDPDNYKE